MKTSKRVLAILMTVAMVLSFATVPTFAADQTLTAVYYWGSNRADDSGASDDVIATANIKTVAYDAAAAAFDEALGKSATVDIPVAYADLATFKAETTVTGTASTFVRKASPYTLNGTKDLAGIKSEGTTVDDSSNPVQIGDYVLIAATGDTTSSLFVILHIVQASGGTIEGEGVPEKVAFKVIVPLDIDFALDPGELNIDGNHIFGADYRVINKTPSYAVQVKFDVTKPSKAGTIANLLPGTSFASSDIKQSKINVVNAASVVLNSSSTELETASYDSAESGAVAIGLDTARRTVAVGAADADTNASTPVSTVFELDKYGTTDSPATTLSTANVGAFTLRGELNRPETLDYKSGDVELVAAYSFKGVGAKKYASDVPALQGANAKPMEIANYGFSGTAIQVAATGVQGATAGTVDNAKHTDKLVSDNPVAGEFTINIAKATGFTANTQFALLNGGSKVKTVWYGEPGNDFFDNTATMTIDETSTPGTSKLKFQSGWYGTGDDFAGTYYQYVELENGDIFMITIVVS